MILGRLLCLVLIVGVVALGVPAPAAATALHHAPPADCGSSEPEKSAPACVQTCMARPLCPPTPAVVGAPPPAPAGPSGLPPRDDRLPGRALGPEPPPPRM